MWYFAWMLGLGFALALGILNAMWLESNEAFSKNEKTTKSIWPN